MTASNEIDLPQLIPMQDGFRRASSTMLRMQNFVQRGGKYDYATLNCRDSHRTSLILLNRFEDGRLFIHDGLHRVASILIGRPSKVIHKEEYNVQEFTYGKYNEVNIDVEYFTPFDPQREVRVASFYEFKGRVREFVRAQQDASKFIDENRHLYVRSRQDHHSSVETLVQFFFPQLLRGEVPIRSVGE